MSLARAFLLPGSSDLGPSSLPRPPRLGALPAVPRHPVRALALFRAVPRARAAGGAVAAPLEVLLLARRLRGQPGGRHAARAAAPPAQHRHCLREVRLLPTPKARDVERGKQRCALGRYQGKRLSVAAYGEIESKS